MGRIEGDPSGRRGLAVTKKNFIDTQELAAILGGLKDGLGWAVNCPAHKGGGQTLKMISSNGGAHLSCSEGCSYKSIKKALIEDFQVELNANPNSAKPHLQIKSVGENDGPLPAAQERADRIISLGDLLEMPPQEIEFIVEGMLMKGGIGLLAGKPKAGKSTLARILALSVARGTPFLGFPVRKGPVLYYGLEEIESEVRRHFEEMGADGTEEIFISTQPLPGREVELVSEDIKRFSPSLVILDPLFRAVKVRDASAYAEVSSALEPLLLLARESGAHIFCVHHLGKGARAGADSILGSTAIRGAFDVNILLNKNDHHRTIQSENRYGEAIEETVLLFDPETKTMALGGSRVDADSERIENEFIAYLRKQGVPCSQKQIDSNVNGKTAWKRHAIRNLLESKQISRSGSGKKGEPFLYTIACSPVPAPAEEQGNKNRHDSTEETPEERSLREAYEAANGR